MSLLVSTASIKCIDAHNYHMQYAAQGVKWLVLSVCLWSKQIWNKSFLIVYTSSKHIEKLEFIRRTSAYLGVANAIHYIHNSLCFLVPSFIVTCYF